MQSVFFTARNKWGHWTKFVVLNRDHIIAVEEVGADTMFNSIITLIGGNEIELKESFEDVLKLLQGVD